MHDDMASEMLYPTGAGGRRFYGGFYDRSQRHGRPTSKDKDALSNFVERMRERGKPGKWRHARAKWKKDNGTIVDKDYELVEWI